MEASVYKVFATPKGSTGTGFLVSGRRTVITNFHVIEKNTEFMVIYRDGKEVQVAAARVIAYKPNLDLAVLRVDRDLPGTPLTLGEFEPEKLTNVVTIGFPAAADDAVKGRPLTVPELIQRLKDPTALDPTVTTGVVSRMTSAESPQLNARTVQHNAAINPGNSGGPLFDKCANVMGVNTLVALNSQGLFFSIHASEVVRILRETGIEYAAVRAPCLTAEATGRQQHDAAAGARHECGAGACRPGFRAAQRGLARRPQQGREPIDHAAGQGRRRDGFTRDAAQAQPIQALGPGRRRCPCSRPEAGKASRSAADERWWSAGESSARSPSTTTPCPPATPACSWTRKASGSPSPISTLRTAHSSTASASPRRAPRSAMWCGSAPPSSGWRRAAPPAS